MLYFCFDLSICGKIQFKRTGGYMITKRNMTAIQLARRSNSLIWDYFVRNQEDKIAECNICNKNISYKTTITNLKQHLKLKHVNALNEFLSRSTSIPIIKRLEKAEVSSETHSSEQEIEYLEEPVQNEHEDLYLISPSSSFNIPPDSHLVEIKTIGQPQQKPYIRVPNPIRSKLKKNNSNVHKSVESLRRIYFMKKCSNLLLERKKLLREIENQKEEHNLKIMILQKTLHNLNKVLS